MGAEPGSRLSLWTSLVLAGGDGQPPADTAGCAPGNETLGKVENSKVKFQKAMEGQSSACVPPGQALPSQAYCTEWHH